MTEKIATLQEIEIHWSLDDVLRAHAFLHIRESMIEEKRKKNSGNSSGTLNKNRIR